MRVTVLAVGSRGDVQPLIALACGLEATGHRVCIATHPKFQPMVRRAGLCFAPVVEGNVSKGWETREGRAWLQRGSRLVPSWIGFLQDAAPVMKERLANCWAACEKADVIVVNPLATLLGLHVRDKAHQPLVRAYFSPIQVSNSFAQRLVWQAFRPFVNAARRQVLGLPPLRVSEPLATLDRDGCPLLYGFSETVVPRALEWGDWVHVTGYWFLDHSPDWRPPQDLEAFLAAGPPPVFVNFGSMGDPYRALALTTAALARAGRRGVLLSGWSGFPLPRLPDHVFALHSVPYDWLFPRMAAVVHHGGAGTTAVGLREGRISVVVPHFADQPFWGSRVASLGLGPPPIPRRKLSVERLAHSIRLATSDSAMRERAMLVAQQIRAEDGIGRAVEAFSRSLTQPQAVPSTGTH